MSTIRISVMTQEGSNQFLEEKELDLEELRKTPNPRQALTAHFMELVRAAIAEIDPSFNL